MSAMKQYLHGVLLCILLISSCSTPLLPEPRLPRESRTELPDDVLLARLRDDWGLLKQVRMEPRQRQQLIQRYNAQLLTLLRRVRHDMFRKYGDARKAFPPIFEVTHGGIPGDRSLNDVYSDIVPAADVRTEELEEHYIIPGLGVPLVGVIPASKIKAGDNLMHFQQQGTVSTITAVLEFPAKPAGKPVLKLIPRHDHEQVKVGKLYYPLAGDFSAPLEIYWNLTDIKRGRLLGLLNPQKLRNTTGLTCIERYDPQKIPVILTHGFASSAETFNNLVNRLQRDPVIRRNYQFWYFNYATGVAWSISAAAYRNALHEARRLFDPQRQNPRWDQMVVVGHSMGGLITHLNQTLPPGQQAVPKGAERSAALLPQLYDFAPIKAGQVVYMATPHRGVPIASNGIVLACMRLVRLPKTLVEEVLTLATLQQDNIITHPGRMAKWFTSIGQLSPDSADIIALNKRPVLGVPTHSIIGDRGRRNSPKSSDGLVPYWSSHIGWGSETIVPADHHVQDVMDSADDLNRVLKSHLSRIQK